VSVDKLQATGFISEAPTAPCAPAIVRRPYGAKRERKINLILDNGGELCYEDAYSTYVGA